MNRRLFEATVSLATRPQEPLWDQIIKRSDTSMSNSQFMKNESALLLANHSHSEAQEIDPIEKIIPDGRKARKGGQRAQT